MLDVKQVTIVGTGLLGASLALALRAKGYNGRIAGVGRRVETLDQARDLGCFDHLTVSTAEALSQARAGDRGQRHLAVVAAPLSHFEEIFSKIAVGDDPALVVTDVGSVKARVCALARHLLPAIERFVGSHPMAGSEQHGPKAACADLFEGKPCVITPESDTDPEALSLVENLWQYLGMRVINMDPVQHDRCVAEVSHVPHAVAALLVKLASADGGDALSIASTGFSDTTRIASGDPDVWVDIFEANQSAVIEATDRLERELARFRKAVARMDRIAIRRMLQGAKQVRDEWETARKQTLQAKGE